MRKLILMAAMSLLATQALAGGSRSLSLAATDASQQATEPATTATAAPPVNVQTATTTSASAPPAAAPQTATAPAVTPAPVAGTSEVAKPKRRQPSTEARVIRELHRHGIYW